MNENDDSDKDDDYDRVELSSIGRKRKIAPQSLLNSTKSLFEGETNSLLVWILRKLSFLCRKYKNKTDIVVKIFGFFNSICDVIGPNILPYLSPILIPLQFAAEAKITDTAQNQIKLISIEILKNIENSLGTVLFLDCMNKVRSMVSDVKAERKASRIIMATSDPVAFAERKREIRKKQSQTNKKKKSNYGKN